MGEHNLFINLFFHDLFFLLCISVSFLLCVWRKHQKAVLPRIHLEEGLWHFRQVTQFILISVRRLLIQACIWSFYRLTPDFIAERLGHANFSELRELDLPHCSLRTVDLGTKDVFINLRRLVSPRHPSSSPPNPPPAPLSLVTWAHSQSLRLCHWGISFTSREKEERLFINIVSKHISSCSKSVKPWEVDYIVIVICLVQPRSLAFSSLCERAKRRVQYWKLLTFLASKVR